MQILFSNKLDDVILEHMEKSNIQEDIRKKEKEASQDIEDTLEEKYWMDSIEIDPELAVNVLRYVFAVCLLAVSIQILYNVIFQ